MRITVGETLKDYVDINVDSISKIATTIKDTDLKSSEEKPLRFTIFKDEVFSFDRLYKELETKKSGVFHHKDLGFFTKLIKTRYTIKGTSTYCDIEFETSEDLLSIINNLINIYKK